MAWTSLMEDNEQRYLEATNQIGLPEEIVERLIQSIDTSFVPVSVQVRLNKWKEELEELATNPNLEPYREILRLQEKVKEKELLISSLIGH